MLPEAGWLVVPTPQNEITERVSARSLCLSVTSTGSSQNVTFLLTQGSVTSDSFSGDYLAFLDGSTSRTS